MRLPPSSVDTFVIFVVVRSWVGDGGLLKWWRYRGDQVPVVTTHEYPAPGATSAASFPPPSLRHFGVLVTDTRRLLQRRVPIQSLLPSHPAHSSRPRRNRMQQQSTLKVGCVRRNCQCYMQNRPCKIYYFVLP